MAGSTSAPGGKGVRIVLILVILLLTGVLVVLGISLAPELRALNEDAGPSGTVVVRQEATSRLSLTDAHSQAQGRAHDWSDAATLVRVEANWYVANGWSDSTMPPVAWSFLYYAPDQGSLATVVVDDTAVHWVEPAAIPIEPRTLSQFPPAYGPDLAWISFLGAGGQEFLADHAEAQVVFSLQETADQAQWRVVALEAGERIEVVVSADTGVVLSSG